MRRWWQNLKVRWGIATDARMAKLWVVFALAGSGSGWLGRQGLVWLGLTDLPLWQTVLLRLGGVFVIYPVVLLLLGALAGEAKWYAAFLRKLFRMNVKLKIEN